MTSGHFVSDRKFSLLSDIDTNQFVHASFEDIVIFFRECLYIDDNSGFTVRNTYGRITDFADLLIEDGTIQAFFSRKLRFSLRSDFSYKNISGSDFGSYANDPVFVDITKGVIADIRNLTGDFFGTELRIAGFALVLFNMNRSVYIIPDELFVNKDSILVVVAFPCHKSDQNILTE